MVPRVPSSRPRRGLRAPPLDLPRSFAKVEGMESEYFCFLTIDLAYRFPRPRRLGQPPSPREVDSPQSGEDGGSTTLIVAARPVGKRGRGNPQPRPLTQPLAAGRSFPRDCLRRPRVKPRGGFPHWIFFPGTGNGRRNPRQRGMLSATAESREDYSWQKRRIYPPRIGKTAFRRADPGPETRDIAYAYRPDHNRWNGQDVHSGNWFVL